MFTVARAKMNHLNEQISSVSDDMIRQAICSKQQFDHDASLECKLQEALSFSAHEERQEKAEKSDQRIESIAECLFDSGLITDEIIAAESLASIEGLYPVACSMLRSKKLRVCGRQQYLSAVLRVLLIIESSYRDVNLQQFTAKTKSHTIELIEQSLNRISPYVK